MINDHEFMKKKNIEGIEKTENLTRHNLQNAGVYSNSSSDG